jgi:hypothetical protein
VSVSAWIARDVRTTVGNPHANKYGVWSRGSCLRTTLEPSKWIRAILGVPDLWARLAFDSSLAPRQGKQRSKWGALDLRDPVAEHARYDFR